jgi:flagellar hook assembly protein FlgD
LLSTHIINYPNPFNPETTISFAKLDGNNRTEIAIYNLKGQKIKTLLNEVLPAGRHSVLWNGTDESGKKVASGVYFYKMKSGSFNSTRKMILVK